MRKLNLEIVEEIRTLYKNGSKIKDLAQKYNVTFASISRVVKNVTYRKDKDVAEVSVVYNLDGKNLTIPVECTYNFNKMDLILSKLFSAIEEFKTVTSIKQISIFPEINHLTKLYESNLIEFNALLSKFR